MGTVEANSEGSITVLVVDDEQEVAEVTARMLTRERAAIEARPTTDVTEARRAAADGTTDCVLSDYEMPTMDGLELLVAVREEAPDLPFILYTGQGSEALASEAIAAGVDGYLRKQTGAEQYTILANQIVTAVEQYRAETALEEREQRYEQTLARLHETTRELLRAGTKDEIYRRAVEAADDVLDVPIVGVYAFDPTDGRLEHVVSTTDARGLLDPEATFGQGDGHVWTVFSSGESAVYPDVGGDPAAASDAELAGSEAIVPLGTHGVMVAATETVDGFEESMVELLQILAANTEAALDRAEREELLRDHDRTLTRKNEELTRLDHTNELVREIILTVATASTREEIETVVCEQLAATDRYVFAWISGATDPPDPRAWAGIDPTYVDTVRAAGIDAPETTLIGEVLDSGGDRLVRDVLEEPGWSDRRREALTYGFQSVLAVPLVAGDHRYGVVVVGVAGADGLTADERAVLADCGQAVGHAIRSVERTRSLVTDAGVELELEVADERLLLARVAGAVEGPVELQGVIDGTGTDRALFVEVPAAGVAALEAAAADWAAVTAVSTVAAGEETAIVELTVPSFPLLEVLRDFDTRLEGATASATATTLRLDVPARVDTRSLVDGIGERYAGVELKARRDATRETAPGGLAGRLRDRLTDRQFEALQAAHYSGFFEWPRDATAEDLAAVLDVAPPTYHYHLRAAERKLVDLALADRTPSQ